MKTIMFLSSLILLAMPSTSQKESAEQFINAAIITIIELRRINQFSVWLFECTEVSEN